MILNEVWKDKDGSVWHWPQVFTSPLHPSLFGFSCNVYCAYPVGRVHLTCIGIPILTKGCELRRCKGLTKPRRVTIHIQHIPVDLPRWRKILGQWLDSLAEAIMQL